MQIFFRGSLGALLLGISVACAFGGTRSYAATLTVANINDSGPGSLRQALLDANTQQDSDSISFAANVTGSINLLSPLPDLTSPITITGPGADVLAVSGNGQDQQPIFSVAQDSAVAISGLSIANGIGNGGVVNSGVLTLTQCIVRNNQTFFSTHGGAGIYSVGTLSLTDCTISGNTSDWEGGGIYVTAGSLTMTRCIVSNNKSLSGSGGGLSNAQGTVVVADSTFSGNTASLYGGAFYNINKGNLTVTGSTCNGNSAIYYGGAVYTEAKTLGASTPSRFSQCTFSGNSANTGGALYVATGTLVSLNCTISGNSAVPLPGDANSSDDGGGGVTVVGELNVKHSIIALNSASSAPDVKGVVSSAGRNLVGNADGSTGFTVATDHCGTSALPLDPKLGPLADNGGPTKTMALLGGSLAIDAGDPAFNTTTTPYDQRGAGFPRKNGSVIDIGAFEFGDNAAPAVAVIAPADGSILK